MELKKYKLKNYIDSFGDGIHGTPNYDENGEYYFVNGNNLKDGKLNITEDTLKVSSKEYFKIKRNLIPYNTILISINGTLGNVALYQNENIALGKSACYLNLKNNAFRFFLRYVIESKEFKKYMDRVAGQSTIKNVSPTQISEYEFFAPPLESQQKIAAVLSTLDDKIALNRRMNAKLEHMAKRLYDHWFVQFDFPNADGKPYKASSGKMVWNETLKREIPEGWEVKKLGEFFTTNRGVSYSTKTITGDTGIPMINLASFSPDGSYKIDGIKLYTGEYTQEKVLKPFDLVMCNTQQTAIDFSKDIIGKALLVPDIFEGDITSSHHVNTLKVHNEKLKFYLYRLFNTDYFHAYISHYASGTNIMGLDFAGVENYSAVIPNEEILSKFADFTLNIEKKKSEIIRENKKLISLRNRLLPLLMNGQVEVK